MPRTRLCPPQFAIALVTIFSAAAFATPPSQEYSYYGGHPRSWQAGVQAHANSLINMTNLNVLTSVPLFAWSGKGPALSISIYHNFHSAVSGVTAPAGAGFTLGAARALTNAASGTSESIHAPQPIQRQHWKPQRGAPAPAQGNALGNRQRPML